MSLETLRELARQEESLTAARILVFCLAIGAAALWERARPLMALLLFTIAAAMGLSYWLIQIATPFGLGFDPALTRQWAQAGVNASMSQRGEGFVWGTQSEASLPAILAGLGVPLTEVHAMPQIAVLLCLGLFATLPLLAIRNRSTGTFAACLLVGGGLWPGLSPYDWLLQNPFGALLSALVAVMLTILVQFLRPASFLHRVRSPILGITVTAAVVGRSPLLLLAATVWLATPFRAVIRTMCRSAEASRLAEAIALLAIFGGSGALWWNPPRTAPGFVEATEQGTALSQPLQWLRQNVPAGEVVLASPEYGALIAALAGRRVLFPRPNETPGQETTLSEPLRRARLYSSTLAGEPVERLADHFGAKHLFLGPGEADPSPPTGAATPDEPRMALVLVYQDIKDFRIFRLTKK